MPILRCPFCCNSCNTENVFHINSQICNNNNNPETRKYWVDVQRVIVLSHG